MLRAQYTVSFDPNIDEGASKGLVEYIKSIDGVQTVEKNGMEIGELISLGETEPQWMGLMHKMLDVMMQQGHRPEPAQPLPSKTEPTQSIEFDEREMAKGLLLDLLKDGPKPVAQIWIDAAEINPPLTIRSVMDASRDLAISICHEQGALCWQLKRR